MTAVHVYAHTLTSVAADVLKKLPYGTLDVVLTNVSYHDDVEMARILTQKRTEYRPGTRFHATPHGLADFLVNFESARGAGGVATTVVIDNLNLFVSNLMLLYNSEYLTLPAIREAIFRELGTLTTAKAQGHLSPDTLVILTSEVDHDYTVRTHLGRLYQQLLYDVNAYVARFLADSYSLLSHGTAIPLTLSTRTPARTPA